ncbi:uncharacterized protein LOC120340577 [Styela clava]
MHGSNEQMHVELQVAMNFIISYLYNKLPRTRVHLYGEELEKLLRLKFNGHWYPTNPMKGSAFRCVHLNSAEIDPSFELAATRSGLDFVTDIKNNLPSELSVWVDPGEVSYAIGGPDGKPGPVKVLYKHQPSTEEVEQNQQQQNNNSAFSTGIQMTHNITSADSYMTFNPHAKDFLPKAPMNVPVDTTYPGDSAMNQLQHRTVPTNFNYSLRPARRLYTVDEFASTKFGSTKMRSNARNLTPFQWMQQSTPTGFPAHQSQYNANDVSPTFPVAPVGFRTEVPTSPIDNHVYQYSQGQPRASASSTSSFSESSSGSSASSSPDHVKSQLMKSASQQSPTRPTWGDSFTLPTTVYKPIDSWSLGQSSSDLPSPHEDFLNFAGLGDFSPFGPDCVQVPSSGNRMMSMAK